MEKIAYYAFILLGISSIVNGMALPFLIDKFSLSLTVAGSLFFIHSLGYLVASTSYPQAARLIDSKKLITIGATTLALSLIVLPLSPVWIGVLIAAFFSGVGGSTIEVGLNASIAEIPGDRVKAVMNWLHFSFGIGALGGPIVLSQVLSWSNQWSLLYSVSGTFFLTLTFLFASKRFELNRPSEAENERGQEASEENLYKEPAFWLLFVAMFVYCGVEIALMGWVTTYLSSEFTVTAQIASLSISLMWLGLTIGRGIAAKVSALVSTKRLLLVLNTGAAVTLLLTAIAPNAWIAAVDILLVGLCLSAIFPTIMLHGTSTFPRSKMKVSGGLLTAASAGGLIVPAALGVIGEQANLRWGILMVAILMAMSVIAVTALPSSVDSQQVSA